MVLPVHGFAVPFHINTVKNASKSDEGEFTYLRINFQTPGQLAGKKEDTVGYLLKIHQFRLFDKISSHLKTQKQPSSVP